MLRHDGDRVRLPMALATVGFVALALHVGTISGVPGWLTAEPSPPDLPDAPDGFTSCARNLAFAEMPVPPLPGWFRRLGGERLGHVDWPRFRADAERWLDLHPDQGRALVLAARMAEPEGADPEDEAEGLPTRAPLPRADPGAPPREAFVELARRRFDQLDFDHSGRITREEAYASALRETDARWCRGRY